MRRVKTDTTALAQGGSPNLPLARTMAVLFADVVDFTRLTEVAEIETHVCLRALRVGIIDPCIISYRGRIVSNAGDGFLATFDSTVDALRCAIDFQRDVALKEASRPPDRKIRFRVGLNVGEVFTDEEDIYGTSVNIAARLQQCSPAGGIVISEPVRAMVTLRMKIEIEDLGQLELKNLSKKI